MSDWKMMLFGAPSAALDPEVPMAAFYYVHDLPQPNGDHEVHQDPCNFMPAAQNRTYLGYFDNCAQAVEEAAKYHSQVNGCYFCARPCHTG